MTRVVTVADVGIDVIIPSRDRPEQLASCLEALSRQSFTGFRVIVVDDGSRVRVQDTPAAKLADRLSLLVLRNESPVGPAASRNTGAAAGDAPYVVFLDDDVRPAGELLARHAGVFARNPGPVVSIGALLPPATGGLPPWDDWQADRVAREHRRLARGEASPSWLHLYTGNVGVRRVDFVEVGGFDDAFARQEDMELGFRLSQLGCRFVFEPSAVAWHENEHSLSSWLRLPAANARNDVLMDRLRPESERLRSLHEELRGRHWLLRLARRALGRPAVSERSARLAAWAGTSLYRLGARRPALSAFSLAWDLEYHRALAQATDRAEGKQPPSGP